MERERVLIDVMLRRSVVAESIEIRRRRQGQPCEITFMDIGCVRHNLELRELSVRSNVYSSGRRLS